MFTVIGLITGLGFIWFANSLMDLFALGGHDYFMYLAFSDHISISHFYNNVIISKGKET